MFSHFKDAAPKASKPFAIGEHQRIARSGAIDACVFNRRTVIPAKALKQRTVLVMLIAALALCMTCLSPTTADAALHAGGYKSHTKVSIKKAAIRYAHSAVYTGAKVKPRVRVKYKGKTLRKGKDYRLSYKNNVQRGKASIIVTGKGKFRGKSVKHFTIRQRKVVMIGSSSSLVHHSSNPANRITTPWPELLANKLGLEDSQWRAIRKYGYGMGRARHQWASLLKHVRQDRTVTDIIIVGGAGSDRGTPIPKVRKGYAKFAKIAKKKYPNARIMHAYPIGIKQKKVVQSRINKRMKIYRQSAKKYGVYWLKHCTKCLTKSRSYVRTADRRHPTQAGSVAIANSLARQIRAYDRANKW